MLSDFRTWLTKLATDEARQGQAAPPSVDLSTVVAQVAALRHEVNLQTKASRTATEQTAEALKLAAMPKADPDEAIRPLVKAMLDIADALTLSHRQIEKARDSLAPALDGLTAPMLPPPPEATASTATPGFFGRMFGSAPASAASWQTWAEEVLAAEEDRAAGCEQALELLQPLLNSLADGYAMSLRRVERVLPQFGLEPIECVGQPFDPDTMEAMEVGEGEGPSGTVIAELRRGYRWRGKLFRFAQVKVAR